MMGAPFTLDFWIVAGFAIVLLGMSKSGFGSGFGSLAVPLIALTIPIPIAIAIVLPLLCVMDVLAVWSYRHDLDRRFLTFAIPFGLLGALLGALLFRVLSVAAISGIVGALTLLFLAQRLLFKPSLQPWPKRLGALLLTASGFTSFISHAGGPPYNAYTLSLRFTPVQFAALASVFFAAVNLAKWAPYAWLGLLSVEYMKISILLMPLAPVGVWLGVRAAHRVSPKWFFRLVHWGMFLTGIKLLSDAWS